MGAKIFAVVAMIGIIFGVVINDISVGQMIDGLIEEVDQCDSFECARATRETFNRKIKFISASVSHKDLTDIESLFCEFEARWDAGDCEVEIIKSRLVSALWHLRRLSSISIESII